MGGSCILAQLPSNRSKKEGKFDPLGGKVEGKVVPAQGKVVPAQGKIVPAQGKVVPAEGTLRFAEGMFRSQGGRVPLGPDRGTPGWNPSP